MRVTLPTDVFQELLALSLPGETLAEVLRRLLSLSPVSSAQLKYPLEDLARGEALLIPWEKNAAGKVTNVMAIRDAVYRYQRRTGASFRREGCAEGMRITRVK